MAQQPILQSIVPLGAVPERLRTAVSKVLKDWGYGWQQVSFVGTAALPPSEHWRLEPGSEDVWIFAVTSGTLAVGDELESAGGRGVGLAVSAFSGGVIPVIPYQARVYECLGRHGGGRAPERPWPPSLPTTPDMEPAAPDQPS